MAAAPLFDPTRGLPNPQDQPPAEYLTVPWLRSAADDLGTLFALRLSRRLLAEDLHLSQLTRPAAAAAPGTLAQVLALGQAAAAQDARCAAAFRVFLESLRCAFLLHARHFGMFHKITDDAAVRGRIPGRSMLATAMTEAYGQPGRILLGKPASDAELARLDAERYGRLDSADPALHARMRASLAQGAPIYVEIGGTGQLIAGFHADAAAWAFFDILTGASRPVPAAAFRDGREPVDVLSLVLR